MGFNRHLTSCYFCGISKSTLLTSTAAVKLLAKTFLTVEFKLLNEYDFTFVRFVSTCFGTEAGT